MATLNGTDVEFSAGQGAGSNAQGGTLTLSAGEGTGSGAGGSIIFKVANGTTTGTNTNTLATALTINDDGNLTVSGDTNTFSSSSSGAPTLVIKNTTNDANSGGMIFTKEKGAAGANGDDLGFILFKGDDTGQNQTDFAKIIGEVSEATDTDEAGKLSLQVAASDGTTTALVSGLVLEGETNTGGLVDVTIGAGTSSTTTVAGNLTVNGDTATFTSANSTYPLVEIKNTTNNANGARLRLTKDKGAAGAANDVNGLIEFYGDDANQEQVKFSEIKSQVKVATQGQEGGKFTISVAEHDGTSTAGLVIEDGDADGELDVTIAAGTSSLTTIVGNMSVAGTISSGTWQGTAIASDYLDADTAHLSGNQTFTGEKTFSDGTKFLGTTTFTNGTNAHDIVNLNKGAGIEYGSVAFRDTTTASNGINTQPFSLINISAPVLRAENTGVNTEKAYTLRIGGAPVQGTNQTLAETASLVVEGGATRLKSQLILGKPGTNSGQIRFSHTSNTNFTTLIGSDSGSNTTYTLPSSLPAGSNTQFLSSDTNGNLSWQTSGGGGGGGAVLLSIKDLTDSTTNGGSGILIDTDIVNLNTNNLFVQTVGLGSEIFQSLGSASGDNVGLGYKVGNNTTDGGQNTFIGAWTGSSNTLGGYNTFIGHSSGGNCTEGSNNTCLGYGANTSTSNTSNEITLGNQHVTELRCAETSIASLSDARDKTDVIDLPWGLDFINSLRPVQFTWDRRVITPDDENWHMNGKKRTGFLAQELQSAMTDNANEVLDLVYESNPERLEVKQGKLVPMLTQAIKDLKTELDNLKTEVAELKKKCNCK